MSDELPRGWASLRLNELVSSRKGKKPAAQKSEASKGFVPYLDIQAIEKGEVSSYGEAASSRLGTNKDIFVVWDGARSGWAGLGREGAIGSTIMALEPKAGERAYVYRWLQSQFNHVNTNTRGTGIPHVDPDVFWNLEIPLAPLAEQRRIVAKLEALLSKVDACQQRLAKIPVLLKRFRQSILAAACSGRLTADWRSKQSVDSESGHVLLDRVRKDRLKAEATSEGRRQLTELPKPYQPESLELPSIPSSWAWASLAEIGVIVTGKTPSKKNAANWNGEIPFIMPEDLAKSDDCLSVKEVAETTNRVSQLGLNTVQHLEAPAVLVCCIGTLGRVGIVRTKAAFSQQLNAIIPHPEINLEYVAFYCHTIEPILRELWPQNTYMPIVNKTLFSSVPIPIPPITEQALVVTELRRKLDEQRSMERSGERGKLLVDKLTQSLFAKAFRGELVPQDPSDEPAEKLLERVRLNIES